jgi:polyphosphate kinase
MKCSAFTDKKIASKLYDASKVGVKIRLIIRGMCIVIPNKKELSENIEVISVVGRYLEHSRAYEFSYKENDNTVQNIFIGSGDIMPRNLDNRVEVIIPIRDLRIKEEIHKMFDLYFTDVTNKYTLLESGKYSIPTIESKEAMCIQDFFISKYKKIAKELVI